MAVKRPPPPSRGIISSQPSLPPQVFLEPFWRWVCFSVYLPPWAHSKTPHICSVDLLGSSILNIKRKDGPRKAKIFGGMCKNMVDRAEELLLSQVNTIHAEPSRSPLLNKVLSWSLMCSCELLHYLGRSMWMWLLTLLLAKLVPVPQSLQLKPAICFSQMSIARCKLF